MAEREPLAVLALASGAECADASALTFRPTRRDQCDSPRRIRGTVRPLDILRIFFAQSLRLCHRWEKRFRGLSLDNESLSSIQHRSCASPLHKSFEEFFINPDSFNAGFAAKVPAHS